MKSKEFIFSHLHRQKRLSEAMETEFDLIVIGGGITGAGILLDAVLRGMNVLLVEKNDFASGTSSKSTKLIHGGLRYLKQFEFGLVRDSGTERAVVHQNACHLVHPERMLLPIVQEGTFGKFSASLAIAFYDRLASVKKEQRKKSLSKAETLKMEPHLNAKALKSGIVYSEYRTDDARLTIEIIKAGIRNSASAFSYMEVEDFSKGESGIHEVQCIDKINDSTCVFRAKAVVSAAGPWVDEVRKLDNARRQTSLYLTKGVHLVFDRVDFPVNNAIYFDAFDGRMLFAIPRRESVYVGTTDSPYNSDLDEIECSISDAEYILNAVNNYFNIPQLGIEHVKSSWAGLRPLIQQKGKGPTELSRKDEIFYSDSGLISIAGGKLTGYRTMAKRVVDIVNKKLGSSYGECSTKEYKIHEHPFNTYQAYVDWTARICEDYKERFALKDIRELCDNFGKDSLLILDQCISTKKNDLILSQLDYCLEYESVFHPLDFLERRTGWLYFNIEKVRRNFQAVIERLNTHFGWSTELKEKMLFDCQRALKMHSLGGAE